MLDAQDLEEYRIFFRFSFCFLGGQQMPSCGKMVWKL